ncbi:hypothetical protein QQP08_004562, partial [Theobroma cacao]
MLISQTLGFVSTFHLCYPLFKISFLIPYPWQGQLLPWFEALLQIFLSQCLSLVVQPWFNFLCRLLLVLIS